MDPVLYGLVNLYVGGELEVQNGNEGYAYRGKSAYITTLRGCRICFGAF
jgi:hypothetical protein